MWVCAYDKNLSLNVGSKEMWFSITVHSYNLRDTGDDDNDDDENDDDDGDDDGDDDDDDENDDDEN